MPTYTYKCKKCANAHDLFHGMSAAPKVKCPKCGGGCIKMLGTGAGIIFKGSGFYETDYKRTSKGSTGTSSGSSEGKTETKSETKSESKTDSKPAKTAAEKA